MAQKINEQFQSQWQKPMFSFFDYLPTKYDASKDEWKVRKLIWDFKQGKRSSKVAKLVASQIRKQFGSTCDTLTFACIPASSAEANALRYEEFAEEVCRLTGAQNAYKAIKVEGERLAIHETKCGKSITTVNTISFDKEFFNGKRVVLFDDVITRGFSYARFACELEYFGAEVLGGYFLGRTLNLQ